MINRNINRNENNIEKLIDNNNIEENENQSINVADESRINDNEITNEEISLIIT